MEKRKEKLNVKWVKKCNIGFLFSAIKDQEVAGLCSDARMLKTQFLKVVAGLESYWNAVSGCSGVKRYWTDFSFTSSLKLRWRLMCLKHVELRVERRLSVEVRERRSRADSDDLLVLWASGGSSGCAPRKLFGVRCLGGLSCRRRQPAGFTRLKLSYDL